MQAVILANGNFPQHQRAFNALRNAQMLVCCDGAIDELLEHGILPSAIVGDLDSISPQHKQRFANIIFHNPDQYCNDLTKAVNWCIERHISKITIVGATGKREDHTLGNISLLVSYTRQNIDVEMITDTGIIVVALKSTNFESHKGQQVSFFAPQNNTQVTTRNLKYPLTKAFLPELWCGSLNESLGETFGLDFGPGPLIVYREF